MEWKISLHGEINGVTVQITNVMFPTNKNSSLQCENSKQTLNFNDSIDEKSCLQTPTLHFFEDGRCSKMTQKKNRN